MLQMTTLSVFTLNCWGIGFGVSKDRVTRFRAIGQFLAGSNFDLVCLQEVWCPSDFKTIIEFTKTCLPYSHFFNHGIIGSGTCILSKAAIVDATFHEFSLNGYPHKIFHGDWFAGKGLGVCAIDFKGFNIHVFVSHLHAEYSRSKDIYLGHRVMQALEAAQWIKLTSSGADLTLYAGDFNFGPEDVPYALLRSVAGLQDSWEEANGAGGGQTCGTHYNTYTSNNELCECPSGKRIDYVMFKCGSGRNVSVPECVLPLPRRIPGYEVSSSRNVEISSLASS